MRISNRKPLRWIIAQLDGLNEASQPGDRQFDRQTGSLPRDETVRACARPPRRVLVAALLVGLLTVALFAPTWNHQMLYWDDDENVLQNPLVVMPAAAGLKHIFTAPFSTDYYPLTYISLAFDHFVWHGRFFGYHVTQTLLHGMNAFLVVLLVWRWTEKLGVALVTGAWFAWHPVQVETVAWVAERKNVLGACFLLLSWLAYLKAQEPPRARCWRFTALGLFILAVLAHALVIVLPALLIAFEVCVRRARWIDAVRRTWLFFVPAAFAALMRVLGHAASGQLVPLFRSSTETILTMVKVVGEYLDTLLWPARLNNHYTVAAVDRLADPGVVITALWLLAWTALVWRAQTVRRWSLFAAAWFLISLAPVLQFVPHPTLRADRYLYISALGFFLLVALLLQKKPLLSRIAVPLSVFYLVGLTLARIPDWHDPKTLWADCVRKNPRSAIGYYSLAGCAVADKDWSTSEQHLRRALELKPDFAEAHERLGAVCLMRGEAADARKHLARALALNPKLAEARHNLTLLEQSQP